MSHRAVVILTALTISTGGALRSQLPSDSQIVLHSTTQEVLLDLIARDKRQKLVTNLRGEDIAECHRSCAASSTAAVTRNPPGRIPKRRPETQAADDMRRLARLAP